jgi:hypothetical protein
VGTKEWIEREAYIERMAGIPESIRDAILEKWLTYTKSENLTEFQLWRLHLMRQCY